MGIITELIESVLNGEKQCYMFAVRRFNLWLYKTGRSYQCNHEETPDRMQNTFMDAYLSLSAFGRRPDFKTRISNIMLNNCFRREKSRFKNETERSY
ncbi:MAG: hypothetical protein LC117_10490 [Bacteroidia bacterium]|nr:hypothetical protein [Bacteroidia bacterium]MCZ2278343.1 hypothetical protein [Bacteroidia bacterium]